MKKRTKRICNFGIVFIMIGILIFQYNINFNINKEPPSNKWGKGEKIASAKVTDFPTIQENNGKYVAALNDGGNLKVLEFDKLGNKLKEKTFKTDNEIINHVGFFNLKDNSYVLDWTVMKVKGNEMNSFKLDKNFNIIEKSKPSIVSELFQIGNEIRIKTYEDKIEIFDFTNNNTKTLNIKDASLVNGIKYKDKYIITFMDDNSKVKYFYYDHKNVTDIKEACSIATIAGQSIAKNTFSADDKYGYFLTEKSGKGGFQVDITSFALDGSKNVRTRKLRIDGVHSIKGIIPVNNGKEAKFLASGSRSFGLKKIYNDIFQFSISNNKIKLGEYISKTKQASMLPSIYKDVAIYCDYEPSIEKHNIFVTSTNEAFKEKNNVMKPVEKKIALTDTMQGFAYSFVYIFIIGLQWIFFAILLIGAMSFLEYKMKPKNRKILFVIISIIVALIKTKVMYQVSYKNYYYYLPSVLSSPMVGIIINLVFSFICYGYAYKLYEDDIDAMPIAKFAPLLLVDSMLTLMVFAPYAL
ncbi:hypothetical protein ACFIJ5_07300 [Haloimpatiens sp. FM7330]|uniref:hypothetical protein n=1 Tax=Haloimpatiens sp. FM7330 TaxID=3298610 RepID=UPI003632261E